MTLKSDIQPQSTHEKAAIVSGEMVNPHGGPLSKAVTLIDRFKVPGRFRVRWDASEFAYGVYFYKLTTGENTKDDPA